MSMKESFVSVFKNWKNLKESMSVSIGFLHFQFSITFGSSCGSVAMNLR